MRTRVSIAAFALAAALATVVPPAARAGPECQGEVGAITVFSGYGTGGGLGTKVYGCIAYDYGVADEDTRYIVPGATTVSIRYGEDVKVPELTAHVKGLGVDKDITLKRTEWATDDYVYDSAWTSIDPTKTGNLQVTVQLETGPVSDTYRTVG